MSKSFTTEAKVGIFVLIGLFLLAYMSLKVGDIRFGKKRGYIVYVSFTNAGGLKKDAAVRIAGVNVGRVKRIALKKSKAHLTLLLSPHAVLEKDVRAMIKTAGVLGEKYVEIIPGKSEEHLKDGDEIITTLSPADLDSLMNKITEIADDIKVVTTSLKHSIGTKESTENIKEILVSVRDTTTTLKNIVEKNEVKITRLFTNLESISSNVDKVVLQNDEKINSFFTNFEEISASLNWLVESNSDQISQAVANLQNFTENLKDISIDNKKDLMQVIVNLKTFSDNISENAPVITAQLKTITNNLNLIIDENRSNVKEGISNINTASIKLKDTLDSLKVVSQRIENSEGTIGKLISEDETYNKLNETLTGINSYLNKAERFKTIVDFRSEFLSDPSEFKHYLTVKLQPSQDKYYFLELIDSPEGEAVTTDRFVTTQVGDESPQTTHIREKEVRDRLNFSIGIAKRYYDLVMRGGIIESTGGFGFDYFFFDDRLKLSFEAYDFNNDDNTHLKTSMQINFLKHIFITAGYDDFIKREKDPSYYFGAGFSFMDDDLKYLFTSLSALSD